MSATKKKSPAKKAAAKPEPTGSQLLHATLPPANETAKKATKAPKLTKEKVFKPSWLVARFRNALHKNNPALKKAKTLKGVATLSDIKTALAMPTEEWESLLASFFNLGGKLEEAEGWE